MSKKGKRVGPYTLLDTIGEGAYSKVKKAVNVETNQTYAVKVLDIRKHKSDDREEWLRREVAVLRKLKHDNIVKLYDVLSTGDKLYLVLEYVTGGDLLDHISKARRLPEDEARHLFHQIVSAVAYIHSEGVVHRDLKPENILLVTKRKVKVADFGLANIATRGVDGGFKLMTTIVGSPDYCAPEVVMEKTYDGFKADVYSLGTILYTMVTGQRPFEAKDDEATLKKVKEGFFVVPRHVSRDCDRLIHRMMELDPERRIDIAGVMQDPWYKSGDQTNVRPPARTANIRRELTTNDVEQAIQVIKVSEAPSNAFSIIAGLQAGDVDALVGGHRDVKLLFTVPDMRSALSRIVLMLRKLACNVQDRNVSQSSGQLRLLVYTTLSSGILTFTTDLQARPPNIVAVTLRLERGSKKDFNEFCRVFSSQLSDLCELPEWSMLRQAKSNLGGEVASPLSARGFGGFSSSTSRASFDEALAAGSPPASPRNNPPSSPRAAPTSPKHPEAPALPTSPELTPAPSEEDPVHTVHLPTDVDLAADTLFTVTDGLNLNPVLLRHSKCGSLQITGFVVPPRSCLITYTIDLAPQSGGTAATIRMRLGKEQQFHQMCQGISAQLEKGGFVAKQG
eukprot:Sspe_Gene.107560::Locus_85757_Transcript_1_1_Confidence_1.000_Length_1926::g.107560::m.107560